MLISHVADGNGQINVNRKEANDENSDDAELAEIEALDLQIV